MEIAGSLLKLRQMISGVLSRRLTSIKRQQSSAVAEAMDTTYVNMTFQEDKQAFSKGGLPALGGVITLTPTFSSPFAL